MPALHTLHTTLSPSIPAIISAPMHLIAHAPLAVSVSAAGGLGFLAAGFSPTDLEKNLSHASSLIASNPSLHRHQTDNNNTLPIGIGYLIWNTSLPSTLPILEKYPPTAVWLYAPKEPAIETLALWAREIRIATGNRSKIWTQVGTVAEALETVRAVSPDVLVIQGQDAGGHGLERGGAGIISLVPEVHDALRAAGHGDIPLVAAGGIADGRGVAAALCLGAQGAVLGTRFLACSDAKIARGYREEILRVADGGASTVRTKLYDELRGTNEWPERYDGRAVVNQSYRDMVAGMGGEENRRLYEEALGKGDEGWGDQGRLTTWAGTGVGLVREVRTAGEIVEGIVKEVQGILGKKD
ncbi:hypothetical protein FQN55_008713 [Onygenales sp. PD_40]|nr:hypothetical protein FQN55_008713 [Onygenales sp. PD_40]